MNVAVAVRRPSRVCFDVSSTHSSPAAVPQRHQTPVVLPSTSASIPASSAPAAAAVSTASVLSITPTDAQPSSIQQLSSLGSGAVPPDGTGTVVPPYLVKLIRSIVQDEMEVVEERLHRDITSMHVDMLIRNADVQVCNISDSVSFFRFLMLIAFHFGSQTDPVLLLILLFLLFFLLGVNQIGMKFGTIFSARQHMCYSAYTLSPVHLSVRHTGGSVKDG